jgi:hypothetical protein
LAPREAFKGASLSVVAHTAATDNDGDDDVATHRKPFVRELLTEKGRRKGRW